MGTRIVAEMGTRIVAEVGTPERRLRAASAGARGRVCLTPVWRCKQQAIGASLMSALLDYAGSPCFALLYVCTEGQAELALSCDWIPNACVTRGISRGCECAFG
eukprot:1387319-Pleurochrysis_carterae.AAC.1